MRGSAASVFQSPHVRSLRQTHLFPLHVQKIFFEWKICFNSLSGPFSTGTGGSYYTSGGVFDRKPYGQSQPVDYPVYGHEYDAHYDYNQHQGQGHGFNLGHHFAGKVVYIYFFFQNNRFLTCSHISRISNRSCFRWLVPPCSESLLPWWPIQSCCIWVPSLPENESAVTSVATALTIWPTGDICEKPAHCRLQKCRKPHALQRRQTCRTGTPPCAAV